MQFKLAFISAALAALVIATPTPRDDELANSCTIGSLECCGSFASVIIPTAADIFTPFDVGVPGLNVILGFNCSTFPNPITAGSSCSAPRHAVCCENNNFNRLIALNCVSAPP
ncbi:hypothetical protein D9757_005956 [Collybiopsis confluens]|uniref:Hydrophobin n=1 Tax=Collybiopsis confluens TaxID=2823264 RepID=A0A8H5MDA6_9AGAR|nr:hypothetical protein D9757_005956 [Collybiopsis confluens]